ncbi:MAG: signal peptidase I [Candidatus Pacebacteria bacterium]|nr:signal peptidase I [Candidatus Paceibacterota bacterium]
MKTFLLGLWEVAEVVLVAAATVFIVRTFLAQPFLVSGASMEPTFSSGNYLLIDEFTYRLREPQRGEVVVFRYPGNPSVYYIKRIIGLPTERVVVQKGEVRIFRKGDDEGLVVKEPYLPQGLKTGGDVTVVLGNNEYFVLGDNRNFSYDSRSWGVLPQKNILGVVRLRLLPFAQAAVFGEQAISFNN